MAENEGLHEEELLEDDFDVGEFVNEQYPIEDKPAEEKPAEEKPAEEEEKPAEEEEKPAEEEAPADDKLPPDFKPGEKPAKEEEKEESDLDMDELDKAIENETNEDKKVNMSKMRTKIQHLQQELAEAKVSPGEAAPEEVKTLREQLDQAHDAIGRLDLQQSPKFQAKYDKPYLDILANITQRVQDKFESPEEARALVDQVARMDPIQREQFLEENVPKEYKNWASRQLDRGDELLQHRQEALREFAKTKESIGQETVVQEEQRVEQYRQAMKTKTVRDLETAGEKLLSHQPGNDKFNAFVDQRRSELDKAFASNDPEVQADLMAKGTLYESYKQMFLVTQAELVKAQQELAAVSRNKPKFNGGDQPGNSEGKGLDDTASIVDEILS